MQDLKKYLLFFNLDAPRHLTPDIVETLQTRIGKIGAAVQIARNVFLVKSDLRAYEIYSGLSRDLKAVEIFVAEINPEGKNIFGSMPESVWNFLSIKTSSK